MKSILAAIFILVSSNLYALELPDCNFAKEDLIVIFDNSFDMWGLDVQFQEWIEERSENPRMPLYIQSVSSLRRGSETMFVVGYKNSTSVCNNRLECSEWGNKILVNLFDKYFEGKAEVTFGCDAALSPFPRFSVGNN
ncbi:MAG: hypothetical protein VXV96_14895 [Bdellovibrionota bacterium]|jgi:hypothetical protein|nr:hypothetical protein [Bdellovibrionota bacterium]